MSVRNPTKAGIQSPIVYVDPNGVHVQAKGISSVQKPNPRVARPGYDERRRRRQQQRYPDKR